MKNNETYHILLMIYTDFREFKFKTQKIHYNNLDLEVLNTVNNYMNLFNNYINTIKNIDFSNLSEDFNDYNNGQSNYIHIVNNYIYYCNDCSEVLLSDYFEFILNHLTSLDIQNNLINRKIHTIVDAFLSEILEVVKKYSNVFLNNFYLDYCKNVSKSIELMRKCTIE